MVKNYLSYSGHFFFAESLQAEPLQLLLSLLLSQLIHLHLKVGPQDVDVFVQVDLVFLHHLASLPVGKTEERVAHGQP